MYIFFGKLWWTENFFHSILVGFEDEILYLGNIEAGSLYGTEQICFLKGPEKVWSFRLKKKKEEEEKKNEDPLMAVTGFGFPCISMQSRSCSSQRRSSLSLICDFCCCCCWWWWHWWAWGWVVLLVVVVAVVVVVVRGEDKAIHHLCLCKKCEAQRTNPGANQSLASGAVSNKVWSSALITVGR